MINQDTKKARPVGGATERAAEPGRASREAHVSTNDSTTAAAGRQIQISDFLLRGAENAVPLRHLVQLTGLRGRYLRRLIQEERLCGVPILSDNVSGYYLPGDELEQQQFIRSMRSRAREIEAVAVAVEAGVWGWQNQKKPRGGRCFIINGQRWNQFRTVMRVWE